MTPLEILILCFVGIGILISIYLSGVFSKSEMALSSANKVRLENEAEEGKRSAKLALWLMNHYDDALAAILIGNNLVNTAASSLTTVFLTLILKTTHPQFDFWNTIATVVLTVLIIIFGETMPKMSAKRRATGESEKIAPFINLFRILTWPICFIVVRFVNLIARPKKENLPEEANEESSEELQSIVETAEDEGAIDANQSELISAAIDFSEITVEEIMTARVDVESIDLSDTRKEWIRDVLNVSHSRLPVYEEDIDHLLGVVHLNHLLKALSDNPNADIRPLLLEPCYVYRTMKLPKALSILKEAKQHLAIVVDEYGGTLGVVTMEDILEQIVGDIWDETDEVQEEVVERTDKVLEIDGDLAIGDFLEMIGVPEEEFEYESATIGGFAIEFKGDFPEEGYEFMYRGNTIRVLEMDGRRVVKVLLEKNEEQEE